MFQCLSSQFDISDLASGFKEIARERRRRGDVKSLRPRPGISYILESTALKARNSENYPRLSRTLDQVRQVCHCLERRHQRRTRPNILASARPASERRRSISTSFCKLASLKICSPIESLSLSKSNPSSKQI